MTLVIGCPANVHLDQPDALVTAVTGDPGDVDVSVGH
jgi:hypothetical protein